MAEQMLSDTPVCSICIANYNGAQIIVNCIESVLAQDCGFPIEIIVHDDASTDASTEIIRERFPQVRLIESKENVGFCISNNRMVMAAGGEYLLLLNNDTILMPRALSALFHQAVAFGNPAILSLPQYNATTGQLIDAGCFLDLFLNPIPNLNMEKPNVGMVIGACFWIPRQLWENLGGFPEWFGSLAEDMYLCCAARLAGYPVYVVTTSGYLHWVGHSFGGGKVLNGKLSSTLSRRKLSERNKTYVMILCYPLPLLLLVLPIHIVFLIFEGAILSIVKRNLLVFRQIYWSCIYSIYSQRHRLMKERKILQQMKRTNLRAFLHFLRPIPHKLCLVIRHGWPNLK